MAKNHNPNLAKIHRNYSIEEVANLYQVHKNTVLAWIKNHGLKTIDNLKPILILGSELRLFHQNKRTKNKRKCLPYEIYCLKCRKPQIPAENMADYIPMTDTTGRLNCLCPQCENLINKYFSLSNIQLITSKLTIAFPEGKKTHNLEGQPPPKQ